MIIYRLTNKEFASDISGEGSKLYGGRWNNIGTAAVYISEFISLCILELLVRASKITSPEGYMLLSIQIPEAAVIEIETKKLKPGWENNVEYSQWIGDQFLKNNKSLVLKVPSAIVPQEHNFILNPLHKDFKKVKIISSELLHLDKRLLMQ
ncbi:MAG: RES family NAD+ phosphorylase [Chitinophagaceae bacterium]|nr:RES family NAD+ phosphorylase [Chitinophagaceae bacterium]